MGKTRKVRVYKKGGMPKFQDAGNVFGKEIKTEPTKYNQPHDTDVYNIPKLNTTDGTDGFDQSFTNQGVFVNRFSDGTSNTQYSGVKDGEDYYYNTDNDYAMYGDQRIDPNINLNEAIANLAGYQQKRGGNIFQEGGYPPEQMMQQPGQEQMMQGQPQQPQMSEEEAQQQQMQQQLMMQVAQLIQQGTKPEKIIDTLVKELELEEAQAIQIVQQTVEMIQQQAQQAQQSQQMDPSMQQQPMMEEGGNPFMPNKEEKDYFQQKSADFVGLVNKTSDIANINNDLEQLGLSPKQLKKGFNTGGTPGIGPGIHYTDFRNDDYGFEGNPNTVLYEDKMDQSRKKFYEDAQSIKQTFKDTFLNKKVNSQGERGSYDKTGYNEYLTDVGGGEGSLSFKDWHDLNQKNDPYMKSGGSLPKFQNAGSLLPKFISGIKTPSLIKPHQLNLGKGLEKFYGFEDDLRNSLFEMGRDPGMPDFNAYDAMGWNANIDPSNLGSIDGGDQIINAGDELHSMSDFAFKNLNERLRDLGYSKEDIAKHLNKSIGLRKSGELYADKFNMLRRGTDTPSSDWHFTHGNAPHMTPGVYRGDQLKSHMNLLGDIHPADPIDLGATLDMNLRDLSDRVNLKGDNRVLHSSQGTADGYWKILNEKNPDMSMAQKHKIFGQLMVNLQNGIDNTYQHKIWGQNFKEGHQPMNKQLMQTLSGEFNVNQKGGTIPRFQPGGGVVDDVINYGLKNTNRGLFNRKNFMGPNTGTYNMTLQGIKDGLPHTLGNINIADDIIENISITEGLEGLGLSNMLMHAAGQQRKMGIGIHPETFQQYTEDLAKLYKGKINPAARTHVNRFDHSIADPGKMSEQIRLYKLHEDGIDKLNETVKALKAKGYSLSEGDNYILDNIVAEADNFSYSKTSKIFSKIDQIENEEVKKILKDKVGGIGAAIGLNSKYRMARNWPEIALLPPVLGGIGYGMYSHLGENEEEAARREQDEKRKELEQRIMINGLDENGNPLNFNQMYDQNPYYDSDTTLDGKVYNHKRRFRQRGGSLPKAQWGQYPVAKPTGIYQNIEEGSGFNQLLDYEDDISEIGDPRYDNDGRIGVTPGPYVDKGLFNNKREFNWKMDARDAEGNVLDHDFGYGSTTLDKDWGKTRAAKKGWRKGRRDWREEQKEEYGSRWSNLSGDMKSNIAIMGLTGVDMFTGAKDRKQAQDDFYDQWDASNIYKAKPADEALNEGHHVKNVGPSDLNPNQTGMGSFGNYGNIARFGGRVGDEVYMDEDELKNFLDGGGQLEYLD